MPIRALLQIEAIGDDSRAYLRAAKGGAVRQTPLRVLRAYQLGGTESWVAELIGLLPRGGISSRRLVPKYDYARANGTGSRGVYLTYLLNDGGVYEVHARVTWKRVDHYYATVRAGAIERISQEEALRCLSARIENVH